MFGVLLPIGPSCVSADVSSPCLPECHIPSSTLLVSAFLPHSCSSLSFFSTCASGHSPEDLAEGGDGTGLRLKPKCLGWSSPFRKFYYYPSPSWQGDRSPGWWQWSPPLGTVTGP